jgi:hypothetical protein
LLYISLGFCFRLLLPAVVFFVYLIVSLFYVDDYISYFVSIGIRFLLYIASGFSFFCSLVRSYFFLSVFLSFFICFFVCLFICVFFLLVFVSLSWCIYIFLSSFLACLLSVFLCYFCLSCYGSLFSLFLCVFFVFPIFFFAFLLIFVLV